MPLYLSLCGVKNLQRKAAVLAVINLTPLFFSNKTNPFINASEVLLLTYYLYHY